MTSRDSDSLHTDVAKIEPSFWGPTVWKVMFIFALAYPLKNPSPAIKQQYKVFYTSLAGVLPCPTCRESFGQHLHDNPIDKSLDSRMKLLRWIVQVYNAKRPPETQIQKIRDISKLVEPDESCKARLDELKKAHPKCRLGQG